MDCCRELPKQGIKNIHIISPGFSSDCLETLEELEEENKEYFLESGGESYNYIPCLNDSEDHIDMFANLIKKHRPKYNVLMKDDKSYPYIQITKEPFPQVLLTRKIKKDGSKYYGPYTDSRRLRTILQVMHKVFPIRSCSFYLDDNSVNFACY